MSQKKENGKIALLKKLPKPEMSDVMGFSFARQYAVFMTALPTAPDTKSSWHPIVVKFI